MRNGLDQGQTVRNGRGQRRTALLLMQTFAERSPRDRDDGNLKPSVDAGHHGIDQQEMLESGDHLASRSKFNEDIIHLLLSK